MWWRLGGGLVLLMDWWLWGSRGEMYEEGEEKREKEEEEGDRACCKRYASIFGWRWGGKGKAMSAVALLLLSIAVMRAGRRDGGSGCWRRVVYAVS